MRCNSKFIVTVVFVLLVFIAAEQTRTLELFSSRLSSTTHASDAIKPLAGDLISVVRVEKPILRWLPFVKYGETVFRHTYQHADGAADMIERDATTRIRLLVLGLCSTSKYDELVNAPFQEAHARYGTR